MSDNIWNAILLKESNPPYVVEQLDLDSVQIFYMKSLNERLTPESYENLLSEKRSPQDLIKLGIVILRRKYAFHLSQASRMSEHYLSFLEEENPENTTDGKFEPDESGEQIIRDILTPNLYCTLLLEAQQKKAEKRKSGASSYSKMEYFPDSLKELLFIYPKEGKRGYNVFTPYQRLFQCLIKSPYIPSRNEEIKNSYYNDRKFLKACVDAITTDKCWTKESFEAYYLLERFFRVNTKQSLFWESFKDSGKRGENDYFIPPSPMLLGGIFYSSPLVFFPNHLLTSLLSHTQYIAPEIAKERKEEARKPKSKETLEITQTRMWEATLCSLQSLHLFIQLSFYYFQFLLWFLRTYIYEMKLDEYDALSRFLFPDMHFFKEFQKKFTPHIYDEGFDIRGAKEKYASDWASFVHKGGYCSASLKCPTLWEIKAQSVPINFMDHDYRIFREIQDSIL